MLRAKQNLVSLWRCVSVEIQKLFRILWILYWISYFGVEKYCWKVSEWVWIFDLSVKLVLSAESSSGKFFPFCVIYTILNFNFFFNIKLTNMLKWKSFSLSIFFLVFYFWNILYTNVEKYKFFNRNRLAPRTTTVFISFIYSYNAKNMQFNNTLEHFGNDTHPHIRT